MSKEKEAFKSKTGEQRLDSEQTKREMFAWRKELMAEIYTSDDPAFETFQNYPADIVTHEMFETVLKIAIERSFIEGVRLGGNDTALGLLQMIESFENLSLEDIEELGKEIDAASPSTGAAHAKGNNHVH
jgi:hypothetical protein